MNLSDYEVKIPYPNKQDFTTYTLVQIKNSFKEFEANNISLVFQETNIKNFIQKLRTFPDFNSISESTMFKTACKHGYAIGKNFDEDAYTVAVEEYRKEVKRCDDQFKSDLFEANNVTNNPKAKILLEKCFTITHSSRGYELVEVFEELVDLIKD